VYPTISFCELLILDSIYYCWGIIRYSSLKLVDQLTAVIH
jgi:hypothetical protein